MLDWIIANKTWLFGGIVGTLLTIISGWFLSRRGKGDINIGSNNRAGKNQTITIDTAAHQTHSGDGDNAGKDNITKG